MGFQIAPHVHFCVASTQVVFLDLSRDRYLGLPAGCAEAFQRLMRSETLTSNDQAALSALVRRGLLIASTNATALRQPPQFASPNASAYAIVSPFKALPNLPAAIFSHALAIYDLKIHKLGRTVARLRDRKAAALRAKRATGKPCEEMIAAFLATRRLIPSQNRCLRWSVATIHYLAGKHAFPELVLGVRATPFHAHAWVQQDGLVLNDTVDFVSQYTPILVV